MECPRSERVLGVDPTGARVTVVTPFRPFPAESAPHRKLGPFDWLGAIAMLRESVRRSCRCETHVLTDVDTDLPGPSFRYVTAQRRLMLWILDVSLCYLRSDDFTDDTVLVSPDALVFQDLRPWFGSDLGVLARTRPKYVDRPILNGVQFWRVAAKDRLVAFYTEALVLAQTLPEPCVRWGADTDALVSLLAPIVLGRQTRAGVSVDFLPYTDVLWSFDGDDLDGSWPMHPVVDFKGPWRKKAMRAYYDATLGARVSA